MEQESDRAWAARQMSAMLDLIEAKDAEIATLKALAYSAGDEGTHFAYKDAWEADRQEIARLRERVVELEKACIDTLHALAGYVGTEECKPMIDAAAGILGCALAKDAPCPECGETKEGA